MLIRLNILSVIIGQNYVSLAMQLLALGPFSRSALIKVRRQNITILTLTIASNILAIIPAGTHLYPATCKMPEVQ